MDRRDLVRRLSGIAWDDFEVKEARRQLPQDIARTVSAFANTKSGTLVFGVEEAGGKYIVSGVTNPDKAQNDFITILRGGLSVERQRRPCRTGTVQAPRKYHTSRILSGIVLNRVL